MVVLERRSHMSVDGGTKGKARTSIMENLYHTVHSTVLLTHQPRGICLSLNEGGSHILPICFATDKNLLQLTENTLIT
jgi:hypothetical protein